MKNYNYTAFLQITTRAIEINLQTDKRTFVIRLCCQLLNNFDDYLQSQAITHWCDKFRLSKKVLQSYKEGKKIIELSNDDRLKEFLSTFIINENEISGQLHIEKNKVQHSLAELTIICENEGLKTTHLPQYLKSSNTNITVVKVYNPLNNLLKDLAEGYNYEPLIQQLADCIKAFDFNDKEDGFYQKRLQYFFHKWICKAAGQVFHIDSNDAMLLWLDPYGGTGKSQLNSWMFSMPEMLNYYIRISENESFMDLKEISKSKFAIDWDELPITKKQYPKFKSYITAPSGQKYNKHTKVYEPYTRQVNFLGSTNKVNRERASGYLLDDDMGLMRRIVPIEIEGPINYKKYTKDIDLRQLWGQAAAEIIRAQETKNTKLLTWECDYADLREQNSRYVNFNIKDNPEAIKNIFPPGEAGKDNLWSATEMVLDLKKRGIKIPMTPTKLGIYCSLNGYTWGRVGNKPGWWIKS